MDFNKHTIKGYLNGNLSNEELLQIQQYSLDVLYGIKNGNDDAFNTLLAIKDIKLFVNSVTNLVNEKFNNKISRKNINSEVQLVLFNFIKNSYRIYNEPNEIQILINSMYPWIGKEVSKRIFKTVSYKEDEYLQPNNKQLVSETISKVEAELVLKEVLTKTEYKLYTDRYVNNKTFVEIADELNLSESAIRKRNRILLDKIKKVLSL